MATKRLERSVMEGGRYRSNKWERRATNTQVRRRVRAEVAMWTRDPEAWDASHASLRAPVCRNFRDKLGPAERWLHAQVGRPWTEVQGYILRSFDTRSIPGQHIVFGHLLPRPPWSTPAQGWRVHRRWLFRVDEDGRLQAEQLVRKRR